MEDENLRGWHGEEEGGHVVRRRESHAKRGVPKEHGGKEGSRKGGGRG
jgi:hypothetical protein